MKVSAIVVAGLLSFPFSNASAQSVNDAQIASIVVTANQVDIDAGELAKSRSTNKDVKAFAELMITDHTGVNKSATDLAIKLKVTPQDNPTSQTLKAGGDKNLAHLKTLKGAAFDRAYVDHEVA
jgi:putative membrane protein